jgi:hypothetical protein
VRDLVPSWTATSVIATVELATTTERDDARVTRAFESARRRVDADIDADLEPLPNQTKVRHTRLSVRAPSSAAAIAQATEISEAMQAAFSREGEGTLSADIRRRTTPVADSSTVFLGDALRIGTAVAGLLGLALTLLGLFRIQGGPDRLPKQFWAATAGGLAIAFAPLLLPIEIVVGLIIMAIPLLIAGVILWKTTQLRHAASWPSTRARIVRSQPRTEHRRRSGEATQAVTVPDVEYEFRLGDRIVRGTRVSVGEADDTEAVLNHYSVGATVPVYYDPKDPTNAVLERDPPLPVLWLYVIAAAILAAGFAVLAVFANGAAILEMLEAHFPENAFVPGMGFFTLGGVLLLALLWSARRQAAEASGWPVTGGHVVSSTVEHYRSRVGGARSGTLATFYEPVIEYAYRVDGREYHSTQIGFGGKLAGSEELARAKSARYPQGADVVVHYDPKSPSNAVLDVKIAYAKPLLVVALMFFGLALFFSGMFR